MAKWIPGVAVEKQGGKKAPSETISYEEAVREGTIGRYTKGVAIEQLGEEERKGIVFERKPVIEYGKVRGGVEQERQIVKPQVDVSETFQEDAKVDAGVTGIRADGGLVSTRESEVGKRFGEYEGYVPPQEVDETGQGKVIAITPAGKVSIPFQFARKGEKFEPEPVLREPLIKEPVKDVKTFAERGLGALKKANIEAERFADWLSGGQEFKSEFTPDLSGKKRYTIGELDVVLFEKVTGKIIPDPDILFPTEKIERMGEKGQAVFGTIRGALTGLREKPVTAGLIAWGGLVVGGVSTKLIAPIAVKYPTAVTIGEFAVGGYYAHTVGKRIGEGETFLEKGEIFGEILTTETIPAYLGFRLGAKLAQPPKVGKVSTKDLDAYTRTKGKGTGRDVVRELGKTYELQQYQNELKAIHNEAIKLRGEAQSQRGKLVEFLEKGYKMKVTVDTTTGEIITRPVPRTGVTELYTPSGEFVGYTAPPKIPPKPPKIIKFGLDDMFKIPDTGILPPSPKMTGSAFKPVSITGTVQTIVGTHPLDALLGIGTTVTPPIPPTLKYAFFKPATTVIPKPPKVITKPSTVFQAPAYLKSLFRLEDVKQITEQTTIQNQSQALMFKQRSISKTATKQQQSQQNQYLQEQKQSQALMFKQISLSGVVSAQRQKQRQRLKQEQKSGMALIFPQIAQQQKQFEKQRQKLLQQSASLVAPPQRLRQIFEEPPVEEREKGLLFKFPDRKPSKRKKKKRRGVIPSRKQKYTPTLVSDFLGVSVRTTPSKKVYRGLEVRPLVTRKKLKKPRNIKDIKGLM